MKLVPKWSMHMFDLEQFTEDCRTALSAATTPGPVRPAVARAVTEPAGILKFVGETKRPQMQKHYIVFAVTIDDVHRPHMMIVRRDGHHRSPDHVQDRQI